jgi:hypothetical protein
MGVHEIKKLLHNKRKLKRLPKKWEKIFDRYISNKGLITRIYRAQKTKLPKIQ